MQKICAWCNRDLTHGRVVCFRCGSTPAPVRLMMSSTINVRVCKACASRALQRIVEATDFSPLVSHGICKTCDAKHFPGQKGKQKKGARVYKS